MDPQWSESDTRCRSTDLFSMLYSDYSSIRIVLTLETFLREEKRREERFGSFLNTFPGERCGDDLLFLRESGFGFRIDLGKTNLSRS